MVFLCGLSKNTETETPVNSLGWKTVNLPYKKYGENLKQHIPGKERKLITTLYIKRGVLSSEDGKILEKLTSLNSLCFDFESLPTIRNGRIYQPTEIYSMGKLSNGYNLLTKNLPAIREVSYFINDFNAVNFPFHRLDESLIGDTIIFPNIEKVDFVGPKYYNLTENPHVPSEIIPINISPNGWSIVIYPKENKVSLIRVSRIPLPSIPNAIVYGSYLEHQKDEAPYSARNKLDRDMASLLNGDSNNHIETTDIVIPSDIKYIGPYSFCGNLFNNPRNVSKNHNPISGNLTFKSGGEIYIGEKAFYDAFDKTTHSIYFNRAAYICENGIENNGGTFNVTFSHGVHLDCMSLNIMMDRLMFKETDIFCSYNAIKYAQNVSFETVPLNMSDINSGFMRSSLSYAKEHRLISLLEVPEDDIETFQKYGFDPEIKNQAPTIVEVKHPGTLLSCISESELKRTRNLAIIGVLDDNDLKVLTTLGEKLMRLDLSLAYTSLSEQTREHREADAAALGALFGLMAEEADNRYSDFRMSTSDYNSVKSFSALVQQAASAVNKSDKNCIIPNGCLQNMPRLNVLILPIWCSKIEDSAICQLPNLREVKLPQKLLYIGEAIQNCPNLKNMTFPTSLNDMGKGAFKGTVLENANFENCDWYRFGDLGLPYRSYPTAHKVLWRGIPVANVLKLPKNVECIDALGLQENGILYCPETLEYVDVTMKNLTIYCKSTTPFKVTSQNSISDCILYVPKGAKTAYYAKFGKSNKIIEY